MCDVPAIRMAGVKLTLAWSDGQMATTSAWVERHHAQSSGLAVYIKWAKM
jgi:hypothetical protein